VTGRRRILLAGLGLILAGNAVALIGVAYNRSGEPDAVVELSERELVAPFDFPAARENSGLTLILQWRTAGTLLPGGLAMPDVGETGWLDRAKLTELGFDITEPDENDARGTRPPLPREAWIVFELDGPARQAALAAREAALAAARQLQADNPGKPEFEQRAEFAQHQLEEERDRNSRLFAIDAGRDRAELRRRYADRARYLVLSGEIRLGYSQSSVTGFISRLDVSTLHVPLAERAAIEPGGKYTVTVAFGKRAEPWIVEVKS
jgi:hypothetical protein